jgi:hypothetical protein
VCRGLGFVPADESLLRAEVSEQQLIDFGDPRQWEEEADAP